MKSKITFLIVFVAGLSVGWLLTMSPTREPGVIKMVNDQPIEQIISQEIPEKDSPSFDAQILFFDLMSQSGFRLGEYYDSVRTKLTESQQSELDNQLINYAQLIFNHRSEDKKTSQKLNGLLGNFSTDKIILEKLAVVYAENKNYTKAIDALAEVKRLSQFTQDFVQSSNKIREYVDQNIQHLIDSKQSMKQEEFYKYLLEKFPGEYEYKWRYANFAYEQKNYEYARFLLEEVRYLPEFSYRARLLAEKIDFHLNNDSAAGVTVSMLKHGESYFVKGMVNEHEPVNLLIDTGASMTVISPELAYSIGLLAAEPDKLLSFQTANGEVVAPVYILESLRIGEYAVKNILVGILPVSNDGRIHGLLGMNFLKQFRFFVDQQNATLELISQP